jgi:possible competence protein comFC
VINLLFLDKNKCYMCKEEEIAAHYLCKNCLKKLDYVANKFKIESYEAHAVYFYNDYMKKMIGDYKLNRNTSLSKVFASILYDYGTINNLFSCDYILPSPSSQKTINYRGFDHIKMITDLFIDKTNCAYLKEFYKIKDTKAQHKIGRDQRAKNLKGAFICKKDLTEKRILLVDDLITTGFTALEIINCLEKSNVKEVVVLSITSEHRIS